MTRTWIALASLAVATPALAKKEPEAVPVKIVVVDEGGQPIPTAIIRHPEEQDRHPVNTATGAWETDRLYLLDGTELKFIKDLEIPLEVSAPGYMSQSVVYKVRKRKNVVTIPLTRLNLDALDPEDGDPVISFGRDKPLDGIPVDGGGE